MKKVWTKKKLAELQKMLDRVAADFQKVLDQKKLLK